MNKPTHLDLDALDKLIDAVGVDEWGADTVKNEGEYGPGEDAVSGFDSYCVIDSKGNTLLDTLNFDQSDIHEEYDEDYFRAWDEPARKVAEFVAAFNPQTCRAIIDRLRKAEAAREGWKLAPVEPTTEMLSAMACSKARDDEGEFPVLMDLIDFSGENKTHTALRSAFKAALAAAPDSTPTDSADNKDAP
jgi:hypothetical protein